MATSPIVVSALGLVMLAGLLGCATNTETSPPKPAASSTASTAVSVAAAVTAIEAGARSIDVRTPAEFEQGHLGGAINIDVESTSFEDEVDKLDPSATYVVYCASGRRAAAAILTMEGAGFSDLINGGGFDDLAAAGLPTADIPSER